VPVVLVRPVVELLAGPDSELHVLDGARHEVSGELGQERTIDMVVGFVKRVSAP
jgi:alpha-beta hydrolase superfamily lysophospholipase